jgi:hypothetical protein
MILPPTVPPNWLRFSVSCRGYVDLNTVADLQYNTGLHITSESRCGDFKPIRTYGKIGERVAALLVSDGSPVELLIRFRHSDLRARDGAAGWIGHKASRFGDGLPVSESC